MRGVEGKIIRMHTLKVVTTEKDKQAVLNILIESLTHTPPEFKYPTTMDFPLFKIV